MNQYPNRGSMFPSKKRTVNSADMDGSFTLDNEVLAYVMDQAQTGREVKLRISAWRKMGGGGVPFHSIQIDMPWAERQARGLDGHNAQPARQQQPQRQPYGGQNTGGYAQRRDPDYGRRAGPAPAQYPQQPQRQPSHAWNRQAGQTDRHPYAPHGEGNPNYDAPPDNRDFDDEIPF